MVRGAPREQAVLAAVVDLLAAVGDESLTTNPLAVRAHAGKTTMYRRWKGKSGLVPAALGAGPDDEFGRHVVDDIALPLIAGTTRTEE